jgi:GDP-L-fucose synthase
LVTGGTGMVGTALQDVLPSALFLSSKDCDLRDQKQCSELIETYIIHLAGRVGGVKANSSYLADFFYDNITMNTNVLECAKNTNVKKVISLLSTCVFPNNTSYPLVEKNIHDGRPHASNFAYAYAKRMLDVQSRAYRDQYGCNFITAIPNNLYGQNDNFDLEDSHVIPAIIRKVWEAKVKNTVVKLWGDGTPLREFTYSKDIARILAFLMERYDKPPPINIGSTTEVSIREVATIICECLEFNGEVVWDTSCPSGQFRKPSSNNELLNTGWDPEEYTSLHTGLRETCEWFKKTYPNIRGA